jgi:beta-phosphoglucomutase-like phosphatase (HAD superfamily)
MLGFACSPELDLARPAVGRATLCSARRPLVRGTVARNRAVTTAKLDALLFDCDGVLADTERDAHRVAFNMAFKEKGIEDVWDEALYGKLLETGGGKERMIAFWTESGWPAGYEGGERLDLVKGLHLRKTELFMELVASGKVPLRNGVKRLIDEARASGVIVAVCSTSNEKAVAEIVKMLGPEHASNIRIFAGDVVPKKKPDPAIYKLAAQELGLDPANTCGAFPLCWEQFTVLLACFSVELRISDYPFPYI